MTARTCRTKIRFSWKKFLLLFTVTFLLSVLLFSVYGAKANAAGISLDINPEEGTDGALGTIEVLFLLVIVSILPSLLLTMTSFTRFIVVLSFLRNALGLQQSPPNQVLIGLSLFMTLFVMSPVFKEIDEKAYKPYREGLITIEQAKENAVKPLKAFMLRQTHKKDLQLFLSISGTDVSQVNGNEELADALGLEIVVPSFITSELKRAFTIGFLLFLPFLIIDIVVSSTLMSMGMVVLPPTTISLPFKVLLFILVDGWNLLLGTLVQGFR